MSLGRGSRRRLRFDGFVGFWHAEARRGRGGAEERGGRRRDGEGGGARRDGEEGRRGGERGERLGKMGRRRTMGGGGVGDWIGGCGFFGGVLGCEDETGFVAFDEWV